MVGNNKAAKRFSVSDERDAKMTNGAANRFAEQRIVTTESGLVAKSTLRRRLAGEYLS
jgi:hypothetical protein